jgi:formylglycine-generating enzyme required for sulfatase activity
MAQGFFEWFERPARPNFDVRRPPASIGKPSRPAKSKKTAKPVTAPTVATPNPAAGPKPATPEKSASPTAMEAPPSDPALAGIALDPSWPKQLYVIGDSVMLGAKPYLTRAFPDWQVTFAGRPSLTVHKAIAELPAGPLGPVALVALGYNSNWQKDRQNFQIWSDRFDKDVEDMLAALKQRGVRKVVWVLLRELTPDLMPESGAAISQPIWSFPYVNERLRAAKLRHPDLALADWVTAARQPGITYDAIHLNPRGGELMVNVVRVAVGLDPLPSKTARPAPAEQQTKPPEQAAASPAAEPPPSQPSAPQSLPPEIRKSVGETGTIPIHAPLKPTYAFRDCPDCPEMVVLPAASFTMGSPDHEAGREDNEGPQRLVTISRPLAVGKFEVTFAEWDACVAAGGCKSNPTPRDEGWGQDKQPVVNVSWDDAVEYVTWLSRTTGKTYRLLSEAEWEYAARGGSSSPYATGAAITAAQANFQTDFSADGSKRVGDYREQPLPVGSFAPNAFGLHDTEGNVSEWVQDNWHENYKGAPTDGSVWQGGDTSQRVLRGGSWYSFHSDLRSASRRGDQPDHRSPEIGFRVGRAL